MTGSRTAKYERRRRVRCELWLQLAVTAERWAREAEDKEPGLLPFSEWPPDEPLVMLGQVYELTPADLAREARQVAQTAENRAERMGYGQWETTLTDALSANVGRAVR